MKWNRPLRMFAATVSAALLALALAVGGFAQTSLAAPPFTNPEWAPFNHAQWVNGAGHDSKFGLVTTSTCPTGYPACVSDGSLTYGGISLKSKYVPSDPEAITALSFDFNANQMGNSGGSPRMVVRFSDGGSGDLRPLTWTPNTWETVDGITSNSWDNNGGTCGFQYATTWDDVMACHSGETITAIYVVNDSGWLYPATGEQVTLDNITVSESTATGPGRNN